MKTTFSAPMLLITVILMDILAASELDLFVPSFPELQSIFGLSAFWVEALLSVNFIGFCLSLLFVGALADRYGRKPIILLGLLLFILGSIGCLWATSYPLLLIGRFLQGVGIAAPATLSFLIIADTYPLKEQQYLIAMLNGLINASVGAAPVAGSYITQYFHWQGNFVLLLVVAVVVAIMVIPYIPASPLPKEKETLSLKGYLPIFQSRPLLLLLIHITFLFVPYWVFTGMAPILYMEDLGVPLSQFGFYQGAIAFSFAIGSLLVGPVIRVYPAKKLLQGSCITGIVGILALTIVVWLDTHNPLVITLAYLLFNLTLIFPGMILYPLCLSMIPQAKGRISAMIQMIRLMLTALGLELAGYYYQGSFQHIGIMIIGITMVAIIALFLILKDHTLMQCLKEEPNSAA